MVDLLVEAANRCAFLTSWSPNCQRDWSKCGAPQASGCAQINLERRRIRTLRSSAAWTTFPSGQLHHSSYRRAGAGATPRFVRDRIGPAVAGMHSMARWKAGLGRVVAPLPKMLQSFSEGFAPGPGRFSLVFEPQSVHGLPPFLKAFQPEMARTAADDLVRHGAVSVPVASTTVPRYLLSPSMREARLIFSPSAV